MGECQVADAKLGKAPQHGERVLDRVAALHSDDHRDLPTLSDAPHVARRVGELEVSIAGHQPLDQIDLLQGEARRATLSVAGRHEGGEDLCVHAPFPQPWDVGVPVLVPD